jgi:LDH2 family malate/lactate/ureidoglycolate dehydrogenase
VNEPEIVAPATLRDFAVRALRESGMPQRHASDTADGMLWADLRDLPMHGVGVKLPQCISRIRAGGTRANPDLRVLRESASSVLIDGQDSWGQVGGAAAMRAAMAKARGIGFGVASLRDTSSAAALGYFADLAVREQLIGIALTNGPALLPAWGGSARQLSNQAHAAGIPAIRNPPIIFDSALSVMSTGEIDMVHLQGGQLPDGVLLDRNGNPTRDPAEWTAGLLMPIGGHRGYAFALALEVLTGVLSGGARQGADVGHPFAHDQPQGVAMLCLAIDPQISMPFERFAARVDRLIDQVHASPTAPGVDRLYVPGERSRLLAEERARTGIPMLAANVERLQALADDLGIKAW